MELASRINMDFTGCHDCVLNVNTRTAHLLNTVITCQPLILAAEAAVHFIGILLAGGVQLHFVLVT